MERVSSEDNPIDAASRGDTRDLYAQRWQVEDAKDWPPRMLNDGIFR